MSAPSLNAVLRAYGLAHRSAHADGFSGLRSIYRLDSEEVLFEGRAHDVWAWLHARPESVRDEDLAALGEGRLLPEEEAALVARLHVEDAVRAAFRDLFPEACARLFPEEP